MSTTETQAVLYVVKVMILNIIREVMKDGFQPTDLGAFLKSPEFDKALTDAVSGSGALLPELSNLSWADDLALARYVYNMATDIVSEIKLDKARAPKPA